MKKLLLIAFTALFTISVNAQSIIPRFGTKTSDDNTGRTLTLKSRLPAAFVAVDTISPDASITYYKFATMTAAKSVVAIVKKSRQWDEITMVFTADATQRIVTLSTGFTANGTLTVAASKKASIKFVFDGAAWVETARFIQP